MRQKASSVFARIRHRVNPTAVAGFFRGLVGDKLPKTWGGKMQFAEQGKILHGIPTIRASDACVFVHGSSDTELGWQTMRGELDYGHKLLLEFNIQPLYVRYNSGLQIHENGIELSRLLSKLTTQNKKLRRLCLVGHSMGGLVIHAAISDALVHHLPWAKKVKKVFLLGTPHSGAPLAQLAEKAEQLLQFIPNPAILLGASVIKLRSKGLRDLAKRQHEFAVADRILLSHADYIFIAGGLTKKPHSLLNRLLGDGMVHHDSALPNVPEADPNWMNWLARLANRRRIHIAIVPGVGHLALRSSEKVYRIIAEHFT